MKDDVFTKHGINQLGFYVEDVEKAARQHSALFGSGPFFYMDPLVQKTNYRGKEIDLELQIAFGQFGDLQIELIQVLSDENPYAEMGHFGLHHYSNWVDDYDAAVKKFTDAGFEPLFTMDAPGGMRVAYFDCYDPWGHVVEFHAPQRMIWDLDRDAAKDWDGSDVWRKLDLGF